MTILDKFQTFDKDNNISAFLCVDPFNIEHKQMLKDILTNYTIIMAHNIFFFVFHVADI